MTDTVLQNLMSRAAMDGFQVAVHAIGDRANAQVLDAIEEMSETYKGDRRWRIEHAQIVDPGRPAALRPATASIASMQPTHADQRPDDGRGAAGRRSGWRAPMPGRRCCKNGVPLAFGIGLSGRKPRSLRRLGGGVHAARTPTAQPFGGWRPEETVTREQAWCGLHRAARAYAGFAEDKFGRLAPGQRADFIIVDRDPLLSSPADLRATKVEETWVGGEKVYVRKAG